MVLMLKEEFSKVIQATEKLRKRREETLCSFVTFG